MTRKLTILYGSETGTAQDFAESVWRDSKRYLYEGIVKPMNSYDIPELINERLVVFVCSTTGIGEEPENMKVFWKFLLKKSLPADSLSGLRFAVIGFGDSSYEKFNFVAKKLHKRLVQLGGSALSDVALCDDQHDLGPSAVYLPWLVNLWKKLEILYPLPPGQTPLPTSPMEIRWNIEAIDEDKENDSRVKSDRDCIYKKSSEVHLVDGLSLKLVSNQRTTSEDHFQDVRMLSFDSKKLSWTPGDILNVRPQNSTDRVDEFFALLEDLQVPIYPETMVQISKKSNEMPVPDYLRDCRSLRCLATQYWDLNAIPRPRTFGLLARNCTNELEKEKLEEFATAQDQDALFKYANRPRRTTVEVLRDFPHATSQLTLEILMELFSVIRPRSFSIASSSRSGRLDLLVAVVEYKTILSVPRLGLCSNWLKGLTPGAVVYGWLKKGTMRLPVTEDGLRSVPLVMIGPGTGLAPFRSVLQEKELSSGNSSVKDILVFGCRNEEKDFHCKEELRKWHKVMSINLVTAFSRDQEDKCYVQHKIAANAELIRKALVADKGTVLVAGNSKNMPKAVKEAITAAVGDDEYIQHMIKSNRYQEETWN